MKRWIKRLLIGGMILLIICIIGLEVMTRTCDCSNQLSPEEERVLVCENSTTYADYDEEANMLLEFLRYKHEQGLTISKEEYRNAMDVLVIEVEQSQLGIIHGTVCYVGETRQGFVEGIAYVGAAIPTPAKLYVKRHELEHLFQPVNDENNETKAHMVASQEYPIGSLATIVYTILIMKRYYSWCCYFAILWVNFKFYFLGFGN